jgi:hypothetical protein
MAVVDVDAQLATSSSSRCLPGLLLPLPPEPLHVLLRHHAHLCYVALRIEHLQLGQLRRGENIVRVGDEEEELEDADENAETAGTQEGVAKKGEYEAIGNVG